ncbi:hypothetical protein NHX12_020770 [Muraenolepis orangiensis]|uniref:protein-tyrosine-phosphatase n=1 Tax=Muraenolepis orangiensis TaxID=630683 RepID=A0A9Q0ES70_9TELE|nr:hypothetical protein NHX12_020770 [Muraenolepis orangiensis]
MDQACILRKFIQGVTAMREGDERGEDRFGTDFMKLRRLSTKYRTEKIYPTNVGEKEENVKKNRYKDILPFDHSRVKVTLKTTSQDTDYINANFIKGMDGPEAYIATQGPLPNTVLDFWRMNWENSVAVIVMACREFEMGRKKCERYFPMMGEEPMSFGPFRITCHENESRRLTHTRTTMVSPCVYTAVLAKIPEDFNVFRLIQEMRTQRHSAVQTKEQYELVHRAIAQLFQKRLLFLESPTSTPLHNSMVESSPVKICHQSDEEGWDKPPPKPPRVRREGGVGDIIPEEPPEPRPVPPILTPSPPSAFPTVTNVRQDNDRYHPKPVMHLLASAQHNMAKNHADANSDALHNQSESESGRTNQTRPSDRQDPDPNATAAVDLNENYSSKSSSSDAAQTTTPTPTLTSSSSSSSSPLSPAAATTSSSAATAAMECSGVPRIERKLSIEIKKVPLQEGPRSFDTSSAVSSSATAAGSGANTNSVALTRSHAFKSRSSQPLLTSSSSLSEDSGAEGGGGGAEPGLLARPNHLPLAGGEKEEEARGGVEVKPGHAPWSSPENVSTATATVTAAPHHADQQPARKVLPLSIAGQVTPTAAANPLEVKTSSSAEWSCLHRDKAHSSKKAVTPSDPALATATDGKADPGGIR